jgi:hypothetical protein
MTPSGYILFLRDETLVLRAMSDDANNGFFNIDRLPTRLPGLLVARHRSSHFGFLVSCPKTAGVSTGFQVVGDAGELNVRFCVPSHSVLERIQQLCSRNGLVETF